MNMSPEKASEIRSVLCAAIEHHRAGRHAQAEAGYRRVLETDPANPDALNHLGLIAAHFQHHAAAVDLFSRAVRSAPQVATFHFNLGTALSATGNWVRAIQSYRNAVEFDPANADVHYCLANALRENGDCEKAIASYTTAVSIRPEFPEAHCNLGVTLASLGKDRLATDAYHTAIAQRADYGAAHYNLALLLHEEGRVKEASAAYAQALATEPDLPEAHTNLGALLKLEGRLEEAGEHFRRALSIRPNSPEAAFNLADVFRELSLSEEATAGYREAIRLRPDYYDAHYNLGLVLYEQNDFTSSADVFRSAIVFRGGSAEAHVGLGRALERLGRMHEAINAYMIARRYQPENILAHDNLLLAFQYAEGVTPEAMRIEHDRYAERFEVPLMAGWQSHENAADPERRLRVGYVTADFRVHSAACFIEPLFSVHNRSDFEIVGYFNRAKEDRLTERFRRFADLWVPCAGLSDDELAERIRADGIDILVDVSGHTAGNRLLTFARKPAPVQVTWLGYPCTTGLKAIDYRITDRHAEPEGMTEHLNVETLWRMPDFFCCYRAHEDSPVPIDHPPADDNGRVTFGCFNNFAKVTDAVLTLWSEILKRSPDARLLLEIVGIDNPKFLGETQDRLSRLGLPRERVELLPRKASNQYVLYNRIDIALDPFPCNGGTTSLDTLWMGVPFVTLEGRHFVSRMGVSILTNAGLPELIAKSEEEYVDLAVRLATDREWLRRIRDGLRERVEASPLMDARGFAANLEVAYREMWRAWCARQTGEGTI